MIYIGYNHAMISHSAALVLHAIEAGDGYGFSVMEITGLPSGTVYPSLRRLEREGLIRSKWEKPSIAEEAQRPARKYYRLTRAGRDVLAAARSRYPLLARLAAVEESSR